MHQASTLPAFNDPVNTCVARGGHFLVQANDIAGLCKRVIFLKFSLWLKMQLNGRVDMDCKSLEEYAGRLERNKETEITVDKDFFVGLIKEVVLRRRIIGRKNKQKLSN